MKIIKTKKSGHEIIVHFDIGVELNEKTGKLEPTRKKKMLIDKNEMGCFTGDCPHVEQLQCNHAKAEWKLEKAIEALTKVMNQPFNGSWDAQAVYIGDFVFELKRLT